MSDPHTTPFTKLEERPARPEATEAPPTEFACPLCGTRFTHGALVCGSCPLNAGCDLVKCPGCGYQYPRTSRLLEWVLRWFRRPGRSPA